jgi:hypothetical protein
MAELTLSDGQRSLELIGTGSTGIWLKQDGLNLPVVGKEMTYAESADSEGRRRIRSKPQNAEGSFAVFISASTDAVFWDWADNLQELVESAHENKGTITYTPPGGEQVTYDLESIQVTGMPQSGVMLNNRIVEVEVSFECLPYGRLAKRTVNLSDPYETEVTALSPSIFLPLAGSAPLTDLSGNARNGTAAGGVTAGGFTPGPLTVGDTGATDFDGTDDRITTTYATRRNFCTNPVASVNTTGWGPGANGFDTFARVTSLPTSSGLPDASITTGFNFIGSTAGDRQDMTATGLTVGVVYTMSYYVHLTSLSASDVSLAAATSGGTSATATVGGSFTRKSLTFTATATSEIIRVFQSGAGACNGHFTAVMLEAASSAGTYFPTTAQLASGEAGWLGTAHASASDIGCFANGTTRTLMGWAYRDVSTASHELMSGDSAFAGNAFPNLELVTGTQNVRFRPQNSGSLATWTSAWPGNAQWVHWALVYNETTDAMSLYVNGSLVSTQTVAGSYAASPGNLIIGRASASAVDSFNGKQAWVSVHQRALTATEISDAYDAGKAQATLVGPIDSFEVPDIPGQVPALGELTLTDTSSQARNHIEVGVQHRYIPASAEPIQRDAVTQITALAGTSNTRAGSLATNILRAGISTTPVAVCVADGEPHSGKWKIRARLWPSAVDTKVRLAWRAGSAPFTREKWVTIAGEDAWYEVDLGTVDIPELAPTHTADFRIEAKAATGLPTLDVDVMYFEPADNYTRLRGDSTQDIATASIIAADDFDAHAAGNLAGKTPDLGTGNWSGAGDADDFGTIYGGAFRSALSDSAGIQNGRFELCGTGVAAAVSVSVDVLFPAVSTSAVRAGGALLRYVDTDNFLIARLTGKTNPTSVVLTKRVAGTDTQIGSAAFVGSGGAYYSLTVTADAAGNVSVYAGPQGGVQSLYITVTADANLATAGALDDGRVGLWDHYTSATDTGARLYDNFVATSTASGAVISNPAMNSAQSVILAHNTALTENAAGTGQGKSPIREGQYLKLPPETRNGNRNRITVKARRLDVDEGFADSGTADTMTATLQVTPRVHLTSG